MSFHHSAQNINVEDGHRLVAQLQTEAGEWVDAEFDLNQILGNDNGRFQWGESDFSHSAEEITFDIEGEESVPVLRALLKNEDGELVGADVNLAERVGNVNGSFEVV
ncbi:CVNH domain-containing protein [Aspergillus foveolatus]|uniref:CVNH domain-containing protein n=1 Tax=Aspergillus foveolatus TaxID=210207 RepID=UPI003CCCFCB9